MGGRREPVPRDRAPLVERLFCCPQDEKGLSQGDRRGSAARRRRDRNASHLEGRQPRTGALAPQSLRPGIRARGPRGLPRRRGADPDDQHVGRQPREADLPRMGRLAREDQPGGRPPRPRGRGRRGRLRRRLDRAARRAGEALRLPPAHPGARDLRGAGATASGVGRRPRAPRDLRQPSRGRRSRARGARALGGHPPRRRNDVSRGRPDRFRRGGPARPLDPRARRRRRRRHELHARPPGNARPLRRSSRPRCPLRSA